MTDFTSAMAQHSNLSEEEQKKAGRATGTTMDAKHVKFLADLIAFLDKKIIDARTPSSFLNQPAYDALPEESRNAIDYALLNISDQVRRIEDYYRSTQTPNASPQLQTMIEHLWDMKSRLEQKHGDVLKF
jgi:hypothetical protein